MTEKRTSEEIRQAVREHYGEAITRNTGCCGPQSTEINAETARRFVHLAGYSDNETEGLPETVTSFGCGNPVSFIEVKPGQTVLDLGSGSGLDLILAASRVGPTGKVIGLDMTPEMIEICRKNLARAGVLNAEVRRGEMEHMPVADNEVDWIISNCVINLSPEKERVFAEAFRVLKPGGRLMISDIVTIDLPDEYRDDIVAWVGCIAGAVEESDYIRLVKEAGFEKVEIVDKMLYTSQSLATLVGDSCCCGSESRPIDQKLIDKYSGKVASVKLSAHKPS